MISLDCEPINVGEDIVDRSFAYSTMGMICKVKGGWLIEKEIWGYHSGGPALAFIPDPNHEWDIMKENK